MAAFIRTMGATYDHGHDIGDHAHGWGQLIYAASGAIHVAAAGQAWLVPSARAVWMPPGIAHRLRMRGTTRLRTVYIPPCRCGELAGAPAGILVPPLLRELILELVRIGIVRDDDRFHRAVGEAMIVALTRAELLPLALTLPADRRALRVADMILASPGSGESLEAIAGACGASLRTVQRLFLDETGMRLSEWRQVARLMAAAALLLDGVSVTEAALEAGYSGVSAFIHAFRGKVGQTPAAFRGDGRGDF